MAGVQVRLKGGRKERLVFVPVFVAVLAPLPGAGDAGVCNEQICVVLERESMELGELGLKGPRMGLSQVGGPLGACGLRVQAEDTGVAHFVGKNQHRVMKAIRATAKMAWGR
jgi:hypothetical protein